MAEKPPEEGYISVVDEEPELLELLKWDAPQTQCEQTSQTSTEKRSSNSNSKLQDVDPFDLPEPTFIETYRLSKDLVKDLCEQLKPVMPADKSKNYDCPVENKVLRALSYYATGKFNKIGRQDATLSHYFMVTAVTQVTEALNHPTIVKKYIHFPHLRQERDVVKAKFYMKCGIPNVVGIVECTHVPIARPPDDQKSHNNKSYHSKKVQIICDSECNIMSVNPSPGSYSHNSILNDHPVRVDLESINQNEPSWLVGGQYYAQKPYIMTPIPKITKKSPDSPEKHYNNLHSQAYSTVLNAIRWLKGRWKCLQANCNKQFDPPMISMMIVACCILHNICMYRGIAVVPMTPAEERLEAMKQKVANGPISKKLNDDEDGNRVRSELVQRLWSDRQCVPESNGPKKRMSKKDKPVESQQNVNQGQIQMLHNHQEEQAKRARMNMNSPPTYSLLQPAWYPPHH